MKILQTTNSDTNLLQFYLFHDLAGFDTKGSPGVRDSQIIMLVSMVLVVGSPTDSLNMGGKYDTKLLVLSFSVDSKRHKS